MGRTWGKLAGDRASRSGTPRPAGASAFFGEPEHLPDLDAEGAGEPLLRGQAGTAPASLQVGDVRGLEVSSIG